MIQAIETSYSGCKFRSRIEARWAVFFDKLGVKWEYEKEGYDLGEAGWYLPDFWLPGLQCWIEIKGEEPDSLYNKKLYALAEGTGHDLYLFVGSIPHTIDSYGPNNKELFAEIFMKEGGWDNGQAWTCCSECGMLGIEFEARAYRLSCKDGVNPCPKQGRNQDRGHNGDDPFLLAAYAAARCARFERGR